MTDTDTSSCYQHTVNATDKRYFLISNINQGHNEGNTLSPNSPLSTQYSHYVLDLTLFCSLGIFKMLEFTGLTYPSLSKQPISLQQHNIHGCKPETQTWPGLVLLKKYETVSVWRSCRTEILLKIRQSLASCSSKLNKEINGY